MNVIFSFDDGRFDAFEAHSILMNFGFSGSFHITTGFVDGTYVSNDFGIDRTPVTPEQLLLMKNNGMDISLHGDKHIFRVDDFLTSYLKAKKWNLIDEKVGISIPNSKYTEEYKKEFIDRQENKLLYIRVGRSKKCYSFLSKIYYVLYHLLHLQSCFNSFNKNNLIETVDKYNVVSMVIKKDCRLKNIINFIKKHCDKNLSLVLMFHSIVESPSDEWEYSKSDFFDLCEYCKKNDKIKVMNLKQFVEEK